MLETAGIDLVGADVEHVAGRARVEHVAPERSTQPADGVLKRAVAVFGASSPQSESISRSVGTTLPASSTRIARSARCFGPPSATCPVSSETSKEPSIRNSSVTSDLRTPRWSVSSIRGHRSLQCAQDSLKSAVSALLAARCRPVGDASDSAGHDSFIRSSRPAARTRSRSCARRGCCLYGRLHSRAGFRLGRGHPDDTRSDPDVPRDRRSSAGAPYPELFVSEADFAAQMRWLARHGYQAVTQRDLWNHWHRGAALPPRPIVLSFDDGYRSVADAAFPHMQRRSWPGVLNLTVKNLHVSGGLSEWESAEADLRPGGSSRPTRSRIPTSRDSIHAPSRAK